MGMETEQLKSLALRQTGCRPTERKRTARTKANGLRSADHLARPLELAVCEHAAF